MTTIYYLSATGNSLQAAKKIRHRLVAAGDDVRLIPITVALIDSVQQPAGDVGFVMPLHFFGVPLLAERFLARLDLHQAGYVFAVMTCGWHYMSTAIHELDGLVSACGAKLAGAFYIDMLSVYLPLGKLPSQDKLVHKLAKAEQRMEAVAELVAAHSADRDNEYLCLVSRLIHRYVQRHQKTLDDKFTVNTACTGCGACARICPANNIRLQQGLPVWQHQCTQCLACLHICPVQAIDLGTRTQGRRRYRHPDITVGELMGHYLSE